MGEFFIVWILEYIATQYHPTGTGSTLFDLPNFAGNYFWRMFLEAGHDLIDNSDMVDCTILPDIIDRK